MAGRVYCGIGGWTFAPWRGAFYPKGTPQKDELAFATRAVTMIEVNGTFYRTQTPATFANWSAAAPPGFRFSLKAPRYAVSRKLLAEAGESIERFVQSGIAELGDKLGPILWQFADTRRFDADDIAAFLALLPQEAAGLPLFHVIEARHASFADPAFHAAVAARGCAVVVADADDYPNLGDGQGLLVYARLQRAQADLADGYPEDELDRWADRARAWAADGRDVHILMINGAKERAPAAAMALIRRLRSTETS